ncbi:ankyrin repeat and SAM domain-containing protein 6-like isoform X2 [Haliotis rubra]|uniref:ankyrin repeat and SAM domain-containing protein 6-like isoform X2 n=1 Tax=Haliotis rubra TaxID=36100 RepID=UPI001EE5D39E|nr:ankyrin repeat and SAM domain-containing protein 6-like isoform X2 [Haliotis rubra]
MSVSTADSGFGTARSSLASSNKSSIIRRSQKPDVNRGDKMKGALKRLFTFGRPKETEGVARPTSVLRVGHDMEYRTKEAAHALATQVTTKRPRVDKDIHAACKEGDLGRLRRILSENLEDVNHRDKDGLTPVMIAALFGHRRLVDVLVKKGATMYLLADNKNNILHLACIGGDKDMVKYVLSQKVADINSRGECGSTPQQRRDTEKCLTYL